MLCQFLVYNKVIQIYIYIYIYIQFFIFYIYVYLCLSIYIVFYILFHYGFLQDIEHSSLCYTVGPCCLSIQVFFNGHSLSHSVSFPPWFVSLSFIFRKIVTGIGPVNRKKLFLSSWKDKSEECALLWGSLWGEADHFPLSSLFTQLSWGCAAQGLDDTIAFLKCFSYYVGGKDCHFGLKDPTLFLQKGILFQGRKESKSIMKYNGGYCMVRIWAFIQTNHAPKLALRDCFCYVPFQRGSAVDL